MVEWEGLFEDKIIDRGYKYYKDDNVVNLEITGNKYKATVLGTDFYDVSLEVSNGEVKNLKCNCPYAEEHNCKHMAALLYEIDSVTNNNARQEDSSNLTNDYETFMSEYGHIDKGDLMEFVYESMNKYLEVREGFLKKFKDDFSFAPFKLEHYKQIIDKIAGSYPKISSCEVPEYRDNPDEIFIGDMIDFLDMHAAHLSFEGYYELSFEILKYSYESLDKVFGKSMGTIYLDELKFIINANIEENRQRTNDKELIKRIDSFREKIKQ